jgi:hypothetical protein
MKLEGRGDYIFNSVLIHKFYALASCCVMLDRGPKGAEYKCTNPFTKSIDCIIPVEAMDTCQSALQQATYKIEMGIDRTEPVNAQKSRLSAQGSSHHPSYDPAQYVN